MPNRDPTETQAAQQSSHRKGILGAILAGGQARRLGGVSKSMLSIGSQTLGQVAVDLLAPRTSEIIALVGPGRPFPVGSVPQVRDLYPNLGPLAGLHAALNYAANTLPSRPRAVVLFAVDQVLAPVEALDALIAKAALQPDANAVYLAPQGIPQPTYAIYRPGIFPEVSRRIKNRESLALKSLLEVPGSVQCSTPYNAECFRGINTPGDLLAARRRKR